jgi:hypothetical protein
MDGESAMGTELRRELEALLTDEVVRDLVAAAHSSSIARWLAGLVL